MLENLSLPLILGIFVIASLVVWFAGIKLSLAVDILDSRLKLGEALGGAVLLAFATNLPEVAITISGSIANNLDLVVGNILGGIAIQTVVLVIIDVIGVKGNKSLSYKAASLTIVMEALLVIVILIVVVMASRLSPDIQIVSISPGPFIVTGIWIIGIWLINKARKDLKWKINGKDPDIQTRAGIKAEQRRIHKYSTRYAMFLFSMASLFTLLAGVLLEKTGNQIADSLNMTGLLFGATILAAVTALPEISTGLASVKLKDYQLSMSDIFGGNAFLPVLFVLADLLTGKAILSNVTNIDIYITGLGILLTTIYIFGLIFRSRKHPLIMGVDSLLVLITYLIGIIGLLFIV